MVQIADKTPFQNVAVVDSREKSDQHGPAQMQETLGSFDHFLNTNESRCLIEVLFSEKSSRFGVEQKTKTKG